MSFQSITKGLVLFGLLGATTRGATPEPIPELRLRLSDNLQEALTTSVNWIDVLPPPRGAVKEAKAPLAPATFKVVLDPGHGGEDLGAVGASDMAEKDIALKIARLVRQQLSHLGRSRDFPLEVTLTRDEDHFVSLPDRAGMANDQDANLFVSIHLNSSPVPKVRGFEVYFMSPRSSDAHADRLAKVENAGEQVAAQSPVFSMLNAAKTNLHVNQSSGFAEAVYQSMSSSLLPNKHGVRQAPFAVLSNTEMPSLLIEVAYLTNHLDRENLRKGYYLKRVADAISQGILLFALGRRTA